MKELQIHKREKTEKVTELRKNGKIPAIFYGPKEESTSITVDSRDFLKIWDVVGGAAIVSLTGVGEEKEVLIHAVEWNPVDESPIHIDFYCIERGKKLTVSVPLVFEGEAPVEKLGGIVTKSVYEIEVTVRPRDIPTEISVDLSTLTDLTSSITISDLHLAAEIEPTANPEETIVSITQVQEEVEEERDVADVEIEGEKEDADTKEEKIEE